MAAHSIVDEGNATIVLSRSNDPFSDVLTIGFLNFYDEWHRPHFPLTSQVICDHLVAILNESFYPDLWKAGLITD